jgi:hypothetical protein
MSIVFTLLVLPREALLAGEAGSKEIRLQFAKTAPIGVLYVVDTGKDAFCEEPRKLKRYQAMGTFFVRQSNKLLFEPNYSCVEKPENLRAPALAFVSAIRANQLELGDAAMAELGRLKNLLALQLANTEVTDQGVYALAELSNLVLLDLSGTGITNASMKAIGKLKNLEILRLDDLPLSDGALYSLTNLRHLKTLTLHHTGITNNGLSILAKLSRLEVLHIGNNTRIDNSGLESIARLENLKSLDVRNTSIRLPECIPAMKRMRSLEVVIFGPGSVSTAAETQFKKALPHCQLLRSKVNEDTFPAEVFTPLK